MNEKLDYHKQQNKQIEKLKKQEKVFKKLEDNLLTKLKYLQTELKVEQEKMRDKDQQLQTVEAELHLIKNKNKGKSENMVEKYQSQIDSYRMKVKQMNEEMQEVEKCKNDQLVEIKTLKQNNKKLQKKIDQLVDKINNKNNNETLQLDQSGIKQEQNQYWNSQYKKYQFQLTNNKKDKSKSKQKYKQEWKQEQKQKEKEKLKQQEQKQEQKQKQKWQQQEEEYQEYLEQQNIFDSIRIKEEEPVKQNRNQEIVQKQKLIDNQDRMQRQKESVKKRIMSNNKSIFNDSPNKSSSEREEDEPKNKFVDESSILINADVGEINSQKHSQKHSIYKQSVNKQNDNKQRVNSLQQEKSLKNQRLDKQVVRQLPFD